MNWYKEGLAYRVGYARESAMYNRLAYFYLWFFANPYHISQANAYLKTMERKGMLFENPYEGFFNKKDHIELIEKVIEDNEEIQLFIKQKSAHGPHWKTSCLLGIVGYALCELT